MFFFSYLVSKNTEITTEVYKIITMRYSSGGELKSVTLSKRTDITFTNTVLRRIWTRGVKVTRSCRK